MFKKLFNNLSHLIKNQDTIEHSVITEEPIGFITDEIENLPQDIQNNIRAWYDQGTKEIEIESLVNKLETYKHPVIVLTFED